MLTVSDSIRADRSKSGISNTYNHDYDCGTPYYPNNSCIEFSGSTMVTLQRVEADLQLVADSTSVKEGSTVHFVYVPNPTSHGGQNIGITDVTRIWIPDDTSEGGNATEQVDSTTACVTVTATTCKRVINGPGTMLVRALVNGRYKEKRVHVNAVPCPTGNPILDNANIRKGMKEIWKLSNFDSVPSRRIERSFAVFDSAGKIIRRLIPIDTLSDGPCSSASVPQTPWPGTPLHIFHSHPFNHLDSLPPECTKNWPQLPAGKFYGYDSKSYGGPSDDDWRRAKNDPLIHYVLDPKQIYRADSTITMVTQIDPSTGQPIQVPVNWQSHLTVYQRKVGSCSLY